MTSRRGKALELFFVDGRPEGMLTARTPNWTGEILVAPRTQLSVALKRPEASHTGTYLLLGKKDDEDCMYVGEGDVMAARIRTHDSSKDWWERVVFITTQANSLDKAQVRYLEARLIQEARLKTDNGNNPGLPGLSEAGRAEMETFIENLFFVLPATGIDAFVTKARPTTPSVISPDSSAVHFILKTPKHGLEAQAELIDGEFIVKKGSDARLKWSSESDAQHTYMRLHDELLKSGIIVPSGGSCTFSENYAFSSPSAAAAVVLGRPTSGREAWKLKDTGQTYADWERQRVADTQAAEDS